MLIIGIDPGTTESALVAFEYEPFPQEMVIVHKEYLPNMEIENWLRQHSSPEDQLAIEFLQSYGMAVGQDVFMTCRWVGRFESAWGFLDSTYLYARPSILTHTTGGVRGRKKSDVRKALMLRFGGTKKGEPLHGVRVDHESDALAVGVYHADGAPLGHVDWGRIS
jgi:hypothetical protein